MLIEFKVANFRSIREEQTLSLVASNADKSLPGCVIERKLPGLAGVKFLKGAALYGANASGKSNVLNAMYFLINFVEKSATHIAPGDFTGTTPFKLDAHSPSKPSTFEITFVAEHVRYLYGCSVTPERVTEEYLIAYPKGSPQRWFHRRYNKTNKCHEWARPSTAFKQDKDLQEKTRENSLFLSIGPQFNHPQLTPIYLWLTNKVRFLDLGADRGIPSEITAQIIKKARVGGRILNLLKSADMGITNMRLREQEIRIGELKQHLSPRSFKRLKNDLKESETIHFLEPVLSHRTEEKRSVDLDFNHEESEGTQRLFTLLGPWIDSLDNGYTLFVDELETSMHPLLVRNLLQLFFSRETNPRGAQIIFTTHNPMLLDTSLLRRDQIWFTEKADTGATRLYPLTDYKPRNREALGKGYLAGRYGAIPYMPEGLKP